MQDINHPQSETGGSNSVENVNIDKVLRGLVKKYIHFTQSKKMRKHFFCDI